MRKICIFLITLLFLNTSIHYMYEKNNSKYVMNDNLINQISARVPNYTTIDNMPNNLKNAVVAVEDRRFYEHDGFDFISIGRALYMDIREGKFKEGGSTISQQLAKNLFLSNDKTIKRKFKEIFFTIELESRYTKKQILEMYLNVIYYGSNTYGIENASKKYFNKDLKKLSLAECAMLAGIPQSPNNYNPEKHIDVAKKRQKMVLNAMVARGFVNKKTREMAWNELLIIN
ncbi:transglycosylase domain-containing protein [Clostridium guangxiense]|uniref:transglycosylase domain-containing protein n=1 Tax=Clostridium guangxiense TaxID=1662055 RepID=UPI001E34D65B|nr:biosynthetic peptidoglycan transglycosylase [Clostridium guangxiense]MCD2346386.1 transglycosylase domain-containing protein [Clostridium guangxiense]